MKRYENISLIKTVCMLIVIISHCMLFYGDETMFPIKADFVSPVVARLGWFLDICIMAAFVLCSGFLYAAGLSKGKPVKQEIVSRIRRLLLPYYLYGTFCLVPVYTLLDIASYGRPGGTGLIQGYISMFLGVFSDHLWFLWMLFWVNLFFILIRPLLKGKRLIVAGCLSVGLAWADAVLLTDVSYFKISQFAPYVMCFFAGVLLFYLDERIKMLPASAVGLIGAAFFAVVLFYSQNRTDDKVLFFIMKMLGGIMIYFLSVLVCKTGTGGRLTNLKIYRYFEKNSMTMYIFCYPTAYIHFKLLYPYIGQYAGLCILTNALLTIAVITVIIQVWGRIKGVLLRNRNEGRAKT